MIHAYVLSVQYQDQENPASITYATVYGTMNVENGESRSKIMRDLLRDLRVKTITESPWAATSPEVILCFELEPETIWTD